MPQNMALLPRLDSDISQKCGSGPLRPPSVGRFSECAPCRPSATGVFKATIIAVLKHPELADEHLKIQCKRLAYIDGFRLLEGPRRGAPQLERFQGKAAVEDGELGRLAAAPDPARPPGFAVRPEERPFVRAEGHRLFHTVPLEAREGQYGRPAGHGSGVMVAALGLVEGAALLPVVARPDVPDDLQAVSCISLVEQPDGSRVFEAGHDLGVIRERVLRPG